MRKILLAGAAIAAAAAYMPTTAHAQSTPVSPVTVYIGGRVFQGVFLGSSSGQNEGASGARIGDVNWPTYMRLYPSADYAAPNGIHYGISAEIRSNGSAGQSRYNEPTTTLYWEHASAYVSSAQFGKLTFGSPTPVLETIIVGSQDDIGTGGWYGEYGWNGGNGSPSWLFADVDETKTSINYYSPSFAGFGFAVGFMPYDNNSASANNVDSGPAGSSPTIDHNKNRIDAALIYGNNFGPLGLKATIGGRVAGVVRDTTPGDPHFQDVKIFDAGVEVSYAGFGVGGHVDIGKYGAGTGNYGIYEPVPDHTKSSTAFILGVRYDVPNPAVPLSVGGSYYYYSVDGNQYNNATTGIQLAQGSKVTFNGGAIGASYKLVPGVTLFLDALYGEQKANDGQTLIGTRTKIDSQGLGVGTYFQW
jgi:predicted porin